MGDIGVIGDIGDIGDISVIGSIGSSISIFKINLYIKIKLFGSLLLCFISHGIVMDLFHH